MVISVNIQVLMVELEVETDARPDRGRRKENGSTTQSTRHRAGIGITEETDAIAVICSEETGAISFAVGGKIERL